VPVPNGETNREALFRYQQSDWEIFLWYQGLPLVNKMLFCFCDLILTCIPCHKQVCRMALRGAQGTSASYLCTFSSKARA
jgi:hypothetical protein